MDLKLILDKIDHVGKKRRMNIEDLQAIKDSLVHLSQKQLIEVKE